MRSSGAEKRLQQNPAGKRKKERGISRDRKRLEEIALLKFPPRENPPYRSDREVARETGLSTQSVSAIVKEIFEQGIVSTQIRLPHEQQEVARLENKVRQLFGLQKVRLVPGVPDILAPLDVNQRRNVQTRVIEWMAPLVAEHLDALLGRAAQKEEQFMLGVAWGRTMRMLAQYLERAPISKRHPKLEVVPIVGITCESLREPTEANVIAMRFAEACGGQSSQLACPAFLETDMWIVKRLTHVDHMLKRLKDCNAVITSMGPIPDDDNAAQEITIANDPVLSSKLFQSARTKHAVGEICYWLFDDQGREILTDYVAVGLGFAGLKKIAADPNRQVILVSGGDRRRFIPLRAALRARLASVLISDTVTARFLIGER